MKDPEKEMRVRLKRARYGYDDLCRECREDGLAIELHAACGRFLISIVDADENEVGRSLVSVLNTRALDRAARQVRAAMEVARLLGEDGRADDDG